MEEKSERQLSHHIPGMSRRIMAFYVDECLRAIFFAPLLGLTWLGASPRLLLLAVFVYLSFRVACLALVGASPGKLLLGLRVVGREGRELEFSQACLRVLADELSLFFAFAPRALAWLRWDRTHLSDWIAETRVISVKPHTEVPRVRPVLGSILVLLGLYWGAKSWADHVSPTLLGKVLMRQTR